MLPVPIDLSSFWGLQLEDFGYRIAGSAKWKVAPYPAFGVAHSRPPCASTMERQIDSPIPIPSGFVVKNAVHSRSVSCCPIPIPVSATVTSTSSPCGRDRYDQLPRPVRDGAIASMPVHHEIEQHLLKLHAVAEHERQSGTRFSVSAISCRRMLGPHER
jgi:hypothetical protein